MTRRLYRYDRSRCLRSYALVFMLPELFAERAAVATKHSKIQRPCGRYRISCELRIMDSSAPMSIDEDHVGRHEIWHYTCVCSCPSPSSDKNGLIKIASRQLKCPSKNSKNSVPTTKQLARTLLVVRRYFFVFFFEFVFIDEREKATFPTAGLVQVPIIRNVECGGSNSAYMRW